MKDNKSPLHLEYTQATESFNNARNKALISKFQNIMNSKKDDLLSFYDVKEILQPANQVYLGMKSVPIKLIVGSEGRYRDFNKFFLPRSEFMRARWERVARAQISDTPLPAIQLYEIGGAYFVRDGNHRVSVARSQGVEEIDAEVISLSSEITITPEMTADDLKKAVIAMEKKIFYEKTDFAKLTGDDNLDFTTTGRYNKIFEHILEHKYFMNQKKEEEIPFSGALVSWYKQIYKPIIKAIHDNGLGAYFPDKSSGDLYIWIVSYWDFLKKKKGPNYPITAAAKNFSHRYGVSSGGLSGYFGKIMDRIFGSN
ncbi:MAG: transcriptional regulator [Treponema sp.]|nr:transcriptional regulator [Treponema sp.]